MNSSDALPPLNVEALADDDDHDDDDDDVVVDIISIFDAYSPVDLDVDVLMLVMSILARCLESSQVGQDVKVTMIDD